MLAVSGRLNLKAGGPSVMVPVDPELVKLLYKPSQWQVARAATEHDRRSIYLIAKRNLRLPFLETFDAPALLTSCARRESSTHAPQALELLNGRLSNDLAAAFAGRLEREVGRRPGPARRPGLPAGAGPAADARPSGRSSLDVPPRPAARGIRPGHVQPERVPVCSLTHSPAPTCPPDPHPPRVRPRRLLRLRRPGAGLAPPRGAGPRRHRPTRSRPSRRTSRPRRASVIFLFMAGGPSHLETFDPKPLLNKLDGQPRPKEFGEAKYQFVQRNAKLLGTRRTFRKYGQSGIEVSDLFPHTASCVDDLAVIRSCHGDMVVHSAAQYELFTGRVVPGFPEHGLVGPLRPRARRATRCRPTS